MKLKKFLEDNLNPKNQIKYIKAEHKIILLQPLLYINFYFYCKSISPISLLTSIVYEGFVPYSP